MRDFNHFNRLFNDFFKRDSFFNLDFDLFNHDEFEKRTYKSSDGSFSFTVITDKRNKETNNEINELKNELELVIEDQNFERAAEIRDELKKLEENKNELISLNKELEESIKSQDFERCIEIRDKIKSLN